jgi:hypothetical protein
MGPETARLVMQSSFEAFMPSCTQSCCQVRQRVVHAWTRMHVVAMDLLFWFLRWPVAHGVGVECTHSGIVACGWQPLGLCNCPAHVANMFVSQVLVALLVSMVTAAAPGVQQHTGAVAASSVVCMPRFYASV